MEESIGALWIKKSKAGKTFISGTIKQTNGQELKIVGFYNDKGDNPNRPDIKLYLSKPREANDEPAF